MEPSTLRPTSEFLGDKIETFKPSRLAIFTGYFLAALILFFGFLGLVHLHQKGHSSIFAYLGVSVLVLSVFSVVLLYSVYMSLYSITIFSGGLLVRRYRRRIVFLWYEIQSVQEQIAYEKVPIPLNDGGVVSHFLPRVKEYYLHIWKNDGEEYIVNKDQVAKIRRFSRILREIAEQNGVRFSTYETRE
ncbi:MAG: hypothetical protein ACRC8S_18200 [Fimbriiglobus sp.]